MIGYEQSLEPKSNYLDFLLRQECIKIVEEFAKNPLTYYFRQPVEDIAYRKIIQHPMDLTTIRQSLEKNEYPNHQAFIRDMNLIFDNAVEYNGKRSLVGGIAIYLKKHFYSKVKLFEFYNNRNYENELFRLSRQFQEILNNPPDLLREKVEIIPLTASEKEETEDFSGERLQKLITNLNNIIKEKGPDKITDLLHSIDEDYIVTENSKLDLATFSRKALLLLENFCKSLEQSNP